MPFTKFSCVFVDMRIWSPRLKREYTECEAWRERVVDRLVALRPDLVIIASDQELPVVLDSDDDPELQGAAVARLIRRLPGAVAIIGTISASQIPAKGSGRRRLRGVIGTSGKPLSASSR